MGSSQSTTTSTPRTAEQRQFQPLGALLRNDANNNNNNNMNDDVINWDQVRQSLREAPEQACLYAHHVEESPLFLALSRSCPVDIAKLLIDEYEDALDHNFHGQTVLDAACKGGSDEDVIKLLLSRRSRFATTVGPNGTLPLHCCRSVGGAKVLIQAYPEGVFQRSRKCGSLPLHHVLQHTREDGNSLELNVELCRVLMEASTDKLPACGMLSRNKKGQTPLCLLIQLLDESMQSSTQNGATNNRTAVTSHLWDFLLSECLPRLMKHNRTFLELHTLIELACCHSQSLMDRALKHFGDQTSQRDQDGRTPLHIAAHIGSCCSTEALESLIQSNPNAPRMTDNEGRLPIDWAAESPHTPVKSLSVLIKGEPRAVDTRDLRDGQYPFVSAAISEQTSINNTYFLLRAKPHVISYFHTP
ncbi:ankyrin repeat domain protein [Nitzschia inconspicua]|uniref:Ankyrin repeat domain protein n=1 Tax=Nitzschia inconspicua TaxID=303405 RepID=A0A9K3KGM3_9STRA|nr:ankyrin repeat domain protein [Nitzschia inconspicua]